MEIASSEGGRVFCFLNPSAQMSAIVNWCKQSRWCQRLDFVPNPEVRNPTRTEISTVMPQPDKLTVSNTVGKHSGPKSKQPEKLYNTVVFDRSQFPMQRIIATEERVPVFLSHECEVASSRNTVAVKYDSDPPQIEYAKKRTAVVWITPPPPEFYHQVCSCLPLNCCSP